MAKKCPHCGERTVEFQPVSDYPFAESGLPKVVIKSGVEKGTCGSCGAGSIRIRGLGLLNKKIALHLAERPGRLSGAEIRFLRKYLGLSGKDFARRVGATPETVSRWENEKIPMGGQAERLLRLMVYAHDPEREMNYEFLDRLDETTGVPGLVLSRGQGGWKSGLEA